MDTDDCEKCKQFDCNNPHHIIASEAEASFWATVARMSPDAKTGDLDPALAARFTALCNEVVSAWSKTNNPE